MRTTLFKFTVALFFLINASCQKIQDSNSWDEVEIASTVLKATDLIEKAPSDNEKKIIYSLLSEFEKYAFWESKITDIIMNEDFTNDQKGFLSNFKDIISPEIFVEGEKRSIFFLEVFPEYLDTLTNHFKPEVIYNIFFNIHYSVRQGYGRERQLATSLNIQSDESGDSQCVCSAGARFTCPYINIFGQFTFGNCRFGYPRTCLVTTKGCGALYEDPCDGDYCEYPAV